jgi:hypothetical protein
MRPSTAGLLGTIVLLSLGIAIAKPNDGATQREAPSLLDQLINSGDVKAKPVGPLARTIEIPRMDKASARAVLIVDYEQYGQKATQVVRVSVGGVGQDVPAAPQSRIATFEIPAAVGVLQTWQIDGQSLLIDVRPHEQILFRSDPCSGWSMTSPTIDPGRLKKPLAYCEVEGRDCRDGFARVDELPARNDKRCRGGGKGKVICARIGAMTLSSAARERVVFSGWDLDDTKEPVELQPGVPQDVSASFMRCLRPYLTVRGVNTFLAIGFGQHWAIQIGADGSVTGKALLASKL